MARLGTVTTLTTSSSGLSSPTAIGGASNTSTAPPQYTGAAMKESANLGSVVALVGFCVMGLLVL